MKSRGFTVPLLALTLLSPWSSQPNAQSKPRVLCVSATLVNFTLDDTSSLIAYAPAELWRPSTTACDNCLAPDAELAYAGTWHDGTHIIPTVDADDLPSDDHNDSKQGKPSSTSHAPTATQTTGQGDDDGDGEGDGDKGKNGGKGHNKRRIARSARQHKSLRRGGADDEDDPFFREKEDSDDAGFVDETISMAFNFTGSAVYVFALVPLFAAPANTTPTFVNLTYTLDSQPIGQFLHSGSPSVQPDSTSYLSSVPVFQKTGLAEGPHTLNVTVGPDSVFLLDYVVFSKSTQFGISGGSSNEPTSTNAAGSASGSQPTTSVGAASATGALNTATDTASPSSKSHNVATFAGAVGGSIGLLSLLALSLAFSLYRRRLKARRRDRTYRHSRGGEAPSVSSFHTDASEDGPPMQGPAPFVPRYFPGTVINTAPPPYSPAPPTSELTTALLTSEPEAPLPSISWSSRRSGGASGDSDSASYADRPPPTPPLNPLAGAAEVEDNYFAPPPSFQIAIASPIPAILAGLSGTTTSESSAPAVRPPTPSPPSPVIPLLAPPPSARPVSATITPVQTPDAGPSSSRTSLALAVPLEPTVSPRASSQSLRIQASEDNTSEPSDSELRPSRHSYPSLRSNSVATSSPVVTTSQPTTAREVGRILVSRDDGGGNISSR